MDTDQKQIQVKKESMKREGDFMNVGELSEILGEYGNVEVYRGFNEDHSPNGSIVLVLQVEGGTLNGEEYYITVPSTNWRRVAEKDSKDKVIGVRKQDDPDTFQESEVAVYMVDHNQPGEVEDWEKELAIKNILHNLDPESPTLGAEFEFNFTTLDKDPDSFGPTMRGLLVEGMMELLNCQREFQPKDPSRNTDHVMEMYRNILDTVLGQVPEGVLLNLAGTSADIGIKTEGYESLTSAYPSEYGVYVEFIARQLMEAMTKHLDYVPKETIDSWDKIAKNNGYEKGITQLMDEVKDLRHWLMNAGHVSINMETDLRGKTSSNINRNTNNLLIWARNLLNSLTYSGSHTANTDIEVEGEPSADGRESLRFIMATAQPAEYIRPDEDIVDKTLTRMLRGDAITPDRTGLATVVHGKELPNTHGDIRSRVTIVMKKFLQILENSKNNAADPTIHIDENGNEISLTASVRTEYTSRSITPDLRRYKQSVDLQEIIFKAANLATKDGYCDVFKWMKDVVGIDIDPETEYETTLEQRFSELRNCLKGDYPQGKLSSMRKLVIYVNDRLENEFGTRHPSEKGALDGLDALNQVQKDFRSKIKELTPEEKMMAYIEGEYPNWGEFEVSLADIDIRTILNTDQEEQLTRGQLLTILRDRFVYAQMLFSKF